VAAGYESRRTLTWRKYKTTLRQEFVIGGFTPAAKSRLGFGAVLLGQYDETGRLMYCGRVGTGFSDSVLRELEKMMRERTCDTPPFVNAQLDPDYNVVTWVEPELVAAVEFGAWTDEGFVRHASYQGLRDDIDPKQVRRETAGGDIDGDAEPSRSARRRAASVKATISPGKVVVSPASPDDAFIEGIRISNPRRTVYPEDGVTKGAVAEYYRDVADCMLPHVTGRPLSIVRCPLGLAGEAFYQREVKEGFPDPVRGVEIGDDHAILIDDRDGLLSLVQMGVLEIHAWGCRLDNTDKPDYLTFDLDPGPGITWPDIVASAEFIRGKLDDLGLQSFVKTSGGKGLHVTVPLVRRTPWGEAKSFAHAVAQELVRIAPRNFVAVMTKAMRQQRIFIDYLRNQHGSTSIAPYSTRARNGATVSTPLSWDDLSPEVEPTAYNVRTVPPRLATIGDPWEGFRDVRQSITAKAKKKLGLPS
jgi:bifunctional non-homologous end joining protein LigD